MSQKCFGANFKANLFQKTKYIRLIQQFENNRIATNQRARQETNCADRTVIGRFSC